MKSKDLTGYYVLIQLLWNF